VHGEVPFGNGWGGWDTQDDIVREWITTLGDLPKEWRRHYPPRLADGKWVSFPLIDP